MLQQDRVLSFGSDVALCMVLQPSTVPDCQGIPPGICHMRSCPAAGVAGYGSQVTMTMALRRVKAAPATAMSYLSVVWGIIAGLLIFSVSCYDCQPGALSGPSSFTS